MNKIFILKLQNAGEKIKEHLNRDSPFVDQKTQHNKDVNSPPINLIQKFKTISIKIYQDFVVDLNTSYGKEME